MVVVYTKKTLRKIESKVVEKFLEEDEDAFIMPVELPVLNYKTQRSIVQNAIQSTSWEEYTNPEMRPQNI
jgi:predicted AAA+ superfamily ATPase